MGDRMAELAKLLSSTSLTDAVFTDPDLWKTRVVPITRPFLQEVMQRFQDKVREELDTPLEIKYRMKAQEPVNKVETRDNARVGIRVGSQGIKSLAVGIRVGVSDYLEDGLVWGAAWWGKQEVVPRVEDLFNEIRDKGEEVRTVTDRLFGGGPRYCYLAKSLSPSELGSRDEQDLIEEMAADLFSVYERVRKIAEEIGDDTENNSRLRRYFAAQGFNFTPHQLATFYTALKTKGFVILSGLSGTGKTRLAQLFADLMCTEGEENHLFVPVRPDWRDSKSLLGYYNPLTEKFQSTKFLRFLLQARDNYRSSLYELKWEADHPSASTLLAEPEAFSTDRIRLRLIAFDTGGQPVAQRAFEFNVNEARQLSLPGRMSELEPFRNAAKIYGLELDRVYPHFIILDEMNLARVEYYFAEFVSVLESGRGGDGWTKEPIPLHDFQKGGEGAKGVKDADGNPIPAEIKLSPNLYFAGTVNVDETTYMFSPKVLDRAFTIEFTEVDFEGYPVQEGKGLSEEGLKSLRQQLLKDFARDGKFAIVDKAIVAAFASQNPKYRNHLTSLDALLQPHDLHFAYRVFDEIMAFLANAKDSPVFTGFTHLDDAFDTAVLMKVLPKFHGPRRKLKRPLLSVLAWADKPDAPEERMEHWEKQVKDQKEALGQIKNLGEQDKAADFAYPRTALKALRMLHALYTTGFASFA